MSDAEWTRLGRQQQRIGNAEEERPAPIPESLVDHVALRLRVEILSGAILPGERIRVAKLERRFGVSHIPIREALRRLEAEGLVATSPRRATVATGLALDDLEGLYDLRRLIEVPVAKRAVERMTDAELEGIRGAFKRLEAVDGGYDSEEFWERHGAFHWAVLAPGASERIRGVLQQLWQNAERYVRLSISTFGSFEIAMEQHREMLDACEARDADRLAQILVEHLSRTETLVRDGYSAIRSGSSADGEQISD